jgi:hypothetical protein
MSPATTLLLAGAPQSSSLDWEHPGLLRAFSEPFSRFVGRTSTRDMPLSAPGLMTAPSWRSIPLERQHLATGYSQDHAGRKGSQCASFFPSSALASYIKEPYPTPGGEGQTPSLQFAEQVLSQFYEQSYARHNGIVSSQLAAASDSITSLHSSDISFDSAHSSGSLAQSLSEAIEIPISRNLSDLKDIPNASYLDSIHPQTMTVDLIIGVISVLPPRAIKTRHGTDVQLIEVLVGDESKSGFGVNFWLPASQLVQGDMKSALGALRPQDVVLMRNIALCSFRGKVYGQSLRREMTKVHLLYRNRIDRTDPGGCYKADDLLSAETPGQQVEKTARVRRWALKFLGAGGAKKGAKSRVFREVLPLDTQ